MEISDYFILLVTTCFEIYGRSIIFGYFEKFWREVKTIFKKCGLLPLGDSSLTMIEGQLFTTFVGRWYKETSSFHLPFGEMTITLNDVSSLFHISLASSFFIDPIISQETIYLTIIEYLRVTQEQVIEEFRHLPNSIWSLRLPSSPLELGPPSEAPPSEDRSPSEVGLPSEIGLPLDS